MMKKIMFVLMCVGLASMASGALSITNGDFEADVVGSDEVKNIVDVTGWYESNDGQFWTIPWFQEDPVAGGIVIFPKSQAGSAIDGAGLLDYVYQNIGTADGASEVKIGFETSADDVLNFGLTVTILQSDGSVVFVPGEEVDVLGAAGMTVIDQKTQLFTGTAGAVQIEAWIFDLSTAGAGDLYLRFNHYHAGYVGLDNIILIIDGCDDAKYAAPPYTKEDARVIGDTNYDCKVNLVDFAALASYWMTNALDD